MYPEILRIGDFVISSYGLMMVLAFLTGNYLLRKDMISLGKDPEMADDLTFQAALGGILGAKIYYLIENLGRVIDDPFGMIFSGSGLVFLGGLMGGTLGVTLVLRKNNLPWLTFADIVAPLLILGYAIGRVGCFLVGDDYGIPTRVSWGIAFENGLPPSTYRVFDLYYPWVDLTGFEPGLLTVHPTQLYEVAMGFAIFAYLWNKRTHVKVVGSLFFTYLILAGMERFVIEFIRTNDRYLLGFTGSQLISIVMIIIGVAALVRPFSPPVSKT